MSDPDSASAPAPAGRPGAPGGQGVASMISGQTGQRRISQAGIILPNSAMLSSQNLTTIPGLNPKQHQIIGNRLVNIQTSPQQQSQQQAANAIRMQKQRANAAIMSSTIRTHSGGANVFVSPIVNSVNSTPNSNLINHKIKSELVFSNLIQTDAFPDSPVHDSTPNLKRSCSFEASPTSLTPGANHSFLDAAANQINSAPTARKRLRLSEEGAERPVIDVKVMARTVEDDNMALIVKLKERYSKELVELYFLTTDGNIMDMFTKSSKTQTPYYAQFIGANPIIAAGEDLDEKVTNQSTDSASSQIHSVQQSQPSPLPQGAEIKIPGVGVTPVAVSTTLPAAVAQLSQQGGTPIVPDPPGSGRIPVLAGSPDRRLSTTATTASGINKNQSVIGSQEQIVEKAKQEAYVMQRITELQKEGLWTEKRLPKQQEPPRIKVHWDYLLEEMVWLATDYAQERKWKKKAAKMCAKMVQKHFQDKAIQAQKAEKAEELHRKKLAGYISKEIKLFWNNAQKIVEFKQKTRLEESRKRALNQHLSFIVDQTEMLSKSLAQGMNKSISDQDQRVTDDEFVPEEDDDPSDDETTIAKEEEAMGKADTCAVSEEVAALQRESEMDLDSVLDNLPSDYFDNRTNPEESEDETESDSDFNGSSDDTGDIEDTIAEEEKVEQNEGAEDPAEEIDMLKADSEMDIDDLRRKYSLPVKIISSRSSKQPPALKPTIESEEESEIEVSDSESDYSMNEDIGLKSLLPTDDNMSNENPQSQEEDIMDNVAALAESIQPRGNTLSSTNVVTPVPFLLKHCLREYQHIGLDWLVTMFDRKLNGILADEMGLGKTIQTIALLAHLACAKENWGPHLIIVPTSVMLNWEMEIKKWCPGFKILTYYGNQKERKLKRTGWTKPNAFHICITSYKLVVQDHQSFRRKKWKYLILDEAQNIKNFKSQRWQMLLNFQTQQRLLLTGTPLQNNLMELWSLMHFLMPNVFQSHREFKEWFSNPVSGMIEGNSEYNESIIKRLHKVLRPFLLRRLKCEVEKQMPGKYEHVVMCRLSKRQRFLYDDFMCRAKTKETLSSGNLLSVINVLMQLRKVCNHPNLFEVRPTVSPFQMEAIQYTIPSLIYGLLEYDPFKHVDLSSSNLLLSNTEVNLSAFVAHRMRRMCTPRRLIEEIDLLPPPKALVPKSNYKFYFRIYPQSFLKRKMAVKSDVPVGASPAMKFIPDPNQSLDELTVTGQFKRLYSNVSSDEIKEEPYDPVANISSQSSNSSSSDLVTRLPSTDLSIGSQLQNLSQNSSLTNSCNSLLPEENASTTMLTAAIVQKIRNRALIHQQSSLLGQRQKLDSQSEFYQIEREILKRNRRKHKLAWLNRLNQRRCQAYPIYGEDLRDSLDA